MAKQQIGLLFGMAGESSIDTGSGKIIKDQLNDIVNALNKSSSTKIKFQYEFNVNKVQKEIQKATEGVKKQTGSLTKQVDNALNTLAGMGGNADKKKYGNVAGVAKEFKSYSDAVVKAKKAYNAWQYDQSNPQLQQNLIDTVRTATNEKKRLDAALSNTTAFDKQALAYNKVIDEITKYQAKNKETLKNTPELAAKLEELNQQLAGGTFKGGNAHNRFLELTNQIRAAGGEAETLGQKIRRIFGEKFGFGVMASAAMYARRAFRELYQSVVEVDSALTQLSIVTGKSMSTLRTRLDGIADSAREANTSVKDMLKSMETYSRLGYSLEQSESMAKITNMYANVAATDVDTATSSLTAILKGYGYDPSQLEDIADILVKVGQEYAISAEELGKGLQTAGATLSITGTDLEKSVALLTAGNAAMQDASRVATALKTSALRIQGTEASIKELEEMGEDVEGLAEGTSKLRDEIKALSGVDIMVSENQYKDMYTIMVELGEVWDDLSQTQQNTILEDIAGKRNSSAIGSIIMNLKDLKNSYEAAANASGTLSKANDDYSDSIQGKIQELSTTFTKLANNLLDSGLIKGVIDLANEVLKLVNFLAEIDALLPAIVAGFTTWKNVGKLNSPNMPAYAQLQLVA